MTAPTRPVVRWFGGKWRLAPWIIAHFPPHRVYVEPFGGGGSVLLRKPRVHAEVYNDLDGEIVNLFRVLRDAAQAALLIEQLRLTPFARDELAAAYDGRLRRRGRAVENPDVCADPVERARRLVVLSFQGYGTNAHAGVPTGFRSNSSRSFTTPTYDWVNYPECLAVTVERLRGVTIENRDMFEICPVHDADDTLFYLDPPYVQSTRGRGNPYDVAYRGYTHELDDAGHARLLAFVRGLKGMVVLSGYPTALYDDALHDWQRIEREAFADGARKRVEVLHISPRAWARLSADKRRALTLHQGELAMEVRA